jgi:hypothetical protein
METSEQINELAAALAKAQGKLKPALKTATNDAFKRNGKGSKYATLNDCVTTAHPTLSECGLALINGIYGHEFVARLVHSSGQWIQQRIPIPGDMTKMTVQQLLACQTYLRRASYSLVGLSTDEDDDGNEAAQVGTFQQQLKPGIGIHSPLGDVDVTDQDKLYASLFINAVKTSDNVRIHQLHMDLHNEGEERYRAVWSLLDSKVRSTVKKVLAEKEAA